MTADGPFCLTALNRGYKPSKVFFGGLYGCCAHSTVLGGGGGDFQEVLLQSGQFQTVPGCLTPASRSLGDLHTTPLADTSALATAVFNKFKDGME